MNYLLYTLKNFYIRDKMVLLAPVLILVYNRKKHLYNCIESLKQCRLADKTDLFIASDAGKTTDDQIIIQDIREYCATIKGFNKVEIISYEKNLGVEKAYNNAVDYILSKYDRFIFSEDDNIFSPNFLEYINDGLECYKNDKQVFAICGYCPPIKLKKYTYDIIKHITCCVWGIGFWKEKYNKVDFFMNNYQQQIYKYIKKDLIKKLSFPVFYEIERCIKEKKATGDVAMSYHCYINNMYNIYPKLSLVRNMGFDGSGLHMKENQGFDEQHIHDGFYKIQFINPPPENNYYIDKQFIKFIIAPFLTNFEVMIRQFKCWLYQFDFIRNFWNIIKRKK